MPKRKTGSEIANLEKLVSDFVESAKTFTESAKTLVESDHEKVALMYDFLFVGKPEESPPVPAFVALMQRNTEDIGIFKKTFNKIAWIAAGVLIPAIGIFILSVYNHIYNAQVVSLLTNATGK